MLGRRTGPPSIVSLAHLGAAGLGQCCARSGAKQALPFRGLPGSPLQSVFAKLHEQFPMARLAAPLWVVCQGSAGASVPFCSLYLELRGTARRRTPCTTGTKTGSVLACTGSGSVPACTGSQPHRGTPTTRESRRRPLKYSPPTAGSVPACTGSVGWAPMSVLCRTTKKSTLGLFSPYPQNCPFGLVGPASSPHCQAALCGPAERALESSALYAL